MRLDTSYNPAALSEYGCKYTTQIGTITHGILRGDVSTTTIGGTNLTDRLDALVATNAILGQGETDLGSGLTVTICNATASYSASPTGTWTLATCAGVLRYPRDLLIISTNGSVIPSYITDLRTGSAGATNLYYLRPSGTGTNWMLFGKSL